MINNIQAKGQGYFIDAVRLLEQYSEYTHSVGQDFRRNAWFGCIIDQISFQEKNSFKSDLEALVQGFEKLQSTTASIKNKYETPELNYSDTVKWQNMLAFASKSDVITPSLLSREAYDYARPHLEQMRKLSETIVPARKKLLESFEPAALQEYDGKELTIRLSGEFKSFFTRLFSKEYKNLIAGIRLHYKGTGKLKYKQVAELADQLKKLQSETAEYTKAESAISGCLGSCYRGLDSDWGHIMGELDTLLKRFLTTDQAPFCLISKMSPSSFSGNQKVFRADAALLQKEITAIAEVKNRIQQKFSPTVLDLKKHGYEYCIRKLKACLAEFDKLDNWIDFRKLLGQLKRADLLDFVGQVIEKQIDPQMIPPTFRKVFYRNWIEYIFFSTPELRMMSRIAHDQAVQNFKEKDASQYEISKAQIKSELSQARPNLDFVAGGSSVAVLRREGGKKRKQMPIRTLLSEIGSLAQIIKPCFLMSPLSVSTFLDPEKIRFDTVIFDEASQIFPQDAIGAIYRGKQLIVVGDDRQMPPSNFFNSSADIDDDDEEFGDVSDFESILDLCCGSRFMNRQLTWHYRSHYEELIAFSNLHFYKNRLVTFPSSSTDHKGIGVDYYYVDGVFDRKSKTNRQEAEFIVDLIFQNIREYPNRSLGVVAFSVAQQNMIDKILSKRREEDPSYEEFFKSDRLRGTVLYQKSRNGSGGRKRYDHFQHCLCQRQPGAFHPEFWPIESRGRRTAS